MQLSFDFLWETRWDNDVFFKSSSPFLVSFPFLLHIILWSPHPFQNLLILAPVSCPSVVNLRLAKRYCTGLKNARVVTFCQSCSLSLSPVLWQQDHMTGKKVVTTGQETVIVMRLNWCFSAKHVLWLCPLSCYNLSWSCSTNVLVYFMWQPSVQSCSPVLPVQFPVPCHLFSDKLLSSHSLLFYQSFFLTLSPVLWQTSVESFGSVKPTVPYPCNLSCYKNLSNCGPLLWILFLVPVSCPVTTVTTFCPVMWTCSANPVPIPVSCPPCLLSYEHLLSRYMVLFYRFRFLLRGWIG